MRLIFLALLLIASPHAFAKKALVTAPTPMPSPTPIVETIEEAPKVVRSFTPLLTIDAKTRDQWKVAFQRAPGSNLNSIFFFNTLTLVVLPRFEIGTSPIFYFVNDHKYNYTAKVNFWRGEHTDWSVGYLDAAFGFPMSPSMQSYYAGKQLIIRINSLQLATNIHPSWTKFIIGASLSSTYTAIEGDDYLRTMTLKYSREWNIDLSYPVHEVLDATIGAGVNRDFGFSAYEMARFGFGGVIAWYRPGKFFSKPSLGIYYTPEIQKSMMLLTTDFY